MNWKKWIFLPLWALLLLTVLSAGLLAAVFTRGWEAAWVAYPIYVLAFYTLCADTLFCVRVLPGKVKRLKNAFRATALGSRMGADPAFRTRVSLYLSLGISLLYVGIQLWSWYLARSWWFVVLGAYYGILSLLRLLLVGYLQKHALGADPSGEWKRARLCACILLLVNLSLSGAVLMILFMHRGFDYPGILIYVMALFTFYSVTHAIIEAIRYRSFASPVMTAAKVVSLSAALVSLLNLESAMFAQFGAAMAQKDQNLMIILTGAGISITVVTLSVLLIVRATQNLRREKNGT